MVLVERYDFGMEGRLWTAETVARDLPLGDGDIIDGYHQQLEMWNCDGK